MSLRRVVHLVEDLGMGGLERIVQTLARNADRRRFEVEVVCARGGGALAPEIEAAGTRVRILGLRSYYPGEILKAARSLRRMRPEVVHSHGHFAGVVARAASVMAGIPVVIHHLHTLDGSLRERHLLVERWLARSTSRILCCSRAVEQDAVDRMHLPRERLLTIHNGIDPPPAAGRDEARIRLDRPDPPVLGCVGSLSPHKGQTTLLRACARLAAGDGPRSIVLVGEGSERSRLETLSLELGLGPRVTFLGQRSDARSLLPAFDLVVVPSIEREGLGLVALEAMDAGVPVVASRLGGLPEAVDEGRTGFLVPPGDAAALAEAILRVLRLPDRGRSLGEAARWRVEAEFRAATMARRVETVYEEALDERRAA
jgi:glycosyltransferase involved in cell wall biosynthesis